MKRQRIVLDIVYDDTFYQSPDNWDWNTLLDMPDAGAVRCPAHTEVVTPFMPEFVEDEPDFDYFAGKTPYFEQIDAPLLLGTVGVLQRETGEEADYVMHGRSVWVQPSKSKGVVYIANSDDGIIVSVYRDGNEFENEVASLQVFHADLEPEETDDEFPEPADMDDDPDTNRRTED